MSNILQKEIPTNMQEPEDTHPGTRHRTASHKAMASHPPTHDMTQKSVTADSPKAHKKASKRTLQKSQQTHPKMVPTCLLFEDITRQRNSEFDTLHATDPAWKPQMQNPEVIAPKGAELRSLFHVSHINIQKRTCK